MTRRKFQTSAELMLLRGLYLTRLPGPLSRPSNTGSTCKDVSMCHHGCDQPCCGQHECSISRHDPSATGRSTIVVLRTNPSLCIEQVAQPLPCGM